MGDRTDACRVLVWIREGDLEDLGIDGENIKMEPQEVGFRGGGTWAGLIWLRIGIGCRLL